MVQRRTTNHTNLSIFFSKITNTTQRLGTQTLAQNIQHIRRSYTSLTSLLSDFPSTTLLINATGLGSLTLEDVKDDNSE
jgi:hypothetical protein